MKYYVEDWLGGTPIKEFDTPEERDEWMDENCEWFSDGCYLEDIGKVCATCDY